jgi:hypothetical protein
MKLDFHHKLFFTFLAWCSIGVYCSDYPLMAFQGFYPYRGEGLITYLIITCLAVSYWKHFETIKPLAWFGIISCLVLSIYFYLHVPTWEDSLGTQNRTQVRFASLFLPDVALSAFACVAGILAMSIHPALSVISFFPILNAGSRSAVIGLLIAWVMCFLLTKSKSSFKLNLKLTRFQKNGMIAIVSILLISLAFEKAYYFEQRIENLPQIKNMGRGARSQWLMQGSRLSQSLPLTGLGLDTLSNHLTPPEGKGYEGLRKYIPDRTHNYPMDIILQTGWIGYTLLLLSLGYALGLAIKYPDRQNWVCLCALISFGLFGLLNPHGMLAECVALTSLFGIKKI